MVSTVTSLTLSSLALGLNDAGSTERPQLGNLDNVMVSTVTSLTLSLPVLELSWINRKTSVRKPGQCYGQHSGQSDIITTSVGTK